ncbi:hypothetical protein Taro_038021 [Colocasia esculenta]|uniref:ATP-dependent RNA helicase n=1 Tax=Colocasia esculenta TaxID=4460 RepID=A0A843W5K0_COLES|nr:hypothetical protein [Colocasia esculenta]
MPWSVLLRERLRAFSQRPNPSILTALRSMGGGPRTFPGGLNKWQFKRMHEKMAREKERKLLEQERQIYQARLRSQIRAELAGGRPPLSPDGEEASASPHGPMTPKEHIKALADRFMKEGAEDLWNEDDGPLRDDPVPGRPPSADSAPPLDLRKIVSDRRNLMDSATRKAKPPVETFGQRRHYSVEARSRSQRKVEIKSRWYPDSDSDSDYGVEDEPSKTFGRRGAGSDFPRSGDVGREKFEHEGGGRKKMTTSSAGLMNHDKKKVRRPPKPAEEDGSFHEELQRIRDELEERKQDAGGTGGKGVDEESVFSQRRFEEYNISPLTLKALTSAGYLQVTMVQEATLQACLDGKDVLVKARAGTGKGMAFLLPVIETVLRNASIGVNQRLPPILALILCPTRELASQVTAEANVLLRYHDGIGVQTLIGGTRFKVDQHRLEFDPCQIIVATPGRLLDHIENKSGISSRLMGLKVLVLDEADHLLDLGFRKDIEKIVDCLPRMRQSLLFSATMPKEVRRMSQFVLKREHEFINTVGSGGQETPKKVLQSYIVASHSLHFEIVHHLLKEHIMQEPEYKVILFCTTAMVTELMFLLLHSMKMNVREMHSRKSQLHRTRISDEFRVSKRLILVTSDVSSRGMNYPDVTLVIQVEDSMCTIDTSIKEAAYHAWLGYYNSIAEVGRDKTTLAELATQFSASIGLQNPPALFRKTALKMGLKDIPGIRIRKF